MSPNGAGFGLNLKLRWKRLVIGALVAVPGFAAIWSDGSPFQSWSWYFHLTITVVWAVAVVLALWNTYSHEERVSVLANEQLEAITERLRISEGAVYGGLLTGTAPTGIPHKYWDYIVYQWNGTTLRPVWWSFASDIDVDLYSFWPGVGATGTAFKEKRLVKASGDPVSNGDYHLSILQRREFEPFKSVVAQPIFDLAGNGTIGVLTGLCKQESSEYDKPDKQSALRNAADVVGVVMERVGLSAEIFNQS